MEVIETSPPVTVADIAAYWGRYRQMLFRIAFNVLRDQAAAEDACQQAMLKACQMRESIHGVHSLGGWLMRTVVNESLGVLRKKKIEMRALANKSHSFSETMIHDDEASERRRAIHEAIGRLPEPARSVVVLRVLNGMSGNQAKEALGCSASQVSRYLHEGMEKLRHDLKAWRPVLGDF